MYIVCVHQGVELYGSDRSFLLVVEGIRRRWPDARIKVVLPAVGPLNERLAAIVDRVEVRSLDILRLAEPVRTIFKSTVGLPWYVGHALRDLLQADLLYINTVVVADYILAARFCSSRSVIHVHEIPKPKAMAVFRGLCRYAKAALIFNSAATAQAFGFGDDVRQEIVHNGVEPVHGATVPDLPSRFDEARPMRIALLGRINSWKGQDLLIEAVARLSSADRDRLRVRIVGSTFGGATVPVDALRQQIAHHGLQDVVTLEPFQDDPGDIYRWADISVVPSRQPEPFGMVAIEAMAHGRPVIAAAHGGLTEIVDESSGWFFPPNDAGALAAAISHAVNHPDELRVRAEGALARFIDRFSVAQMQQHLGVTLASWMGPEKG